MTFDFIKAISQQIADNVPGLTEVSAWRGQYEQSEESHNINAPCVYIQIEDIYWKDKGQGSQEGDCQIVLHFVGGYIGDLRNPHVDDYEITAYQNAIEIFLDSIHAAIGEFEPKLENEPLSTKLMRTNTRQLQGADELNIWHLRYTCKLYDKINWRYRTLAEHQVENILVAYKSKVQQNKFFVQHIDSDGAIVELAPGEPMICKTPEPLEVDFTITIDGQDVIQVNDETEVTFTAFGDIADNFIWFDVEANKAIGRGNPLVTNIEYGYGLRSIELRVTNEFSSLMGSIVKQNVIDVTIKEVDDFFDRVDLKLAELAVTYDYSSERLALEAAIFKIKRSQFHSVRAFFHTYPVIYPVITACPEVAVMSFFEFKYLPEEQTADGMIINGGSIVGNYYVTNGIDQGIYMGCDVNLVRPYGSQFWAHNYGQGTQSDSPFNGTKSNNNSRHTYMRFYQNAQKLHINSFDPSYDIYLDTQNERGHLAYGTSIALTFGSKGSETIENRFYTTSNYDTPIATKSTTDVFTNLGYYGGLGGVVGYADYGSTYLNPSFALSPYVEWGGHWWGDFRPSTDEEVKELCLIIDQFYKEMGRVNEWD